MPQDSMILRPALVCVGGRLRSDLEVVVTGSRIAAVREAGSAPRAAVERLPGCALLPGFVNAHSHAFQRGLRGRVQWIPEGSDDDFWSWRERMYGMAGALDPEGVQAISALAFLEMVCAGFTAVGEFHYLHHQPDGTPYDDPDELAHRVVAAADEAGIAVALLRVAYARAGAGRPPTPRQRRFCDADADAPMAACERLKSRYPGRSIGLAPHSVRAVPADWLRIFASWDGPMHAHVDEQAREIEESLAEHGRRPLAVFADAGCLSDRFTAVHLTWPDDEEIALLRASGAGVCVCPTTELDLGDGVFRADRLDGAPLSIGTDSHARIDPFAEIGGLEMNARGQLQRRNVLSPPGDPGGLARRLLAAGAAGGARALGLDTGAIAPGLRADLIAIDLHDPALAPAGADDATLTALVFAGHPGMVRHVWVGGRRVVSDRRHPRARAIVDRAAAALARLA